MQPQSRRRFLELSLGAAAAAMAVACGTGSADELGDSRRNRPAGSGRLSARAHRPTTPSAAE
ncbi:MAG: twin-arginine translocation signal domain-containing protein, partial [Gemmatimonadota bacterium]|nr:twin-arginine translocation signal domain-containing protein [Gemmatimonadota bacterium]